MITATNLGLERSSRNGGCGQYFDRHELLQDRIGSYTGRVVLLTSDEIAVDHGMWCPRSLCDITCGRNPQAIFQEPGRVARKARLCLFLIAETG